MEILSEAPRVVRYKKFLSDDEVAHLLKLAEGKYVRSTVVDNSSGESVVSDYRTGELYAVGSFKDDVIRAVEERIAAVTETKVEQGETFQLVKYGPGDQYKIHHDWFDPKLPGSVKQLKWGGQRIKTALLYLKAPDEGGVTQFQNLGGLTVTPVAGDLLVFEYSAEDLKGDHAGLPVVKGEKIVATKWIRERAADGSQEPEAVVAKTAAQQALLDARAAAMVAQAAAQEATRVEGEQRVNACGEELEKLCQKYRCRLYAAASIDIDPRTGVLRARATVELDPMV